MDILAVHIKEAHQDSIPLVYVSLPANNIIFVCRRCHVKRSLKGDPIWFHQCLGDSTCSLLYLYFICICTTCLQVSFVKFQILSQWSHLSSLQMLELIGRVIFRSSHQPEAAGVPQRRQTPPQVSASQSSRSRALRRLPDLSRSFWRGWQRADQDCLGIWILRSHLFFVPMLLTLNRQHLLFFTFTSWAYLK